MSKQDDETLALTFLEAVAEGVTVTAKQPPYESTVLLRPKKLPKRDTKRARGALAKLLRSPSPLSRALRTQLAELFDPQSKCRYELKLGARRAGGELKALEHRQIAAHVLVRTRTEPFEAAVAAAMDLFGLSRSTVTTAYAKYRDSFSVQDTDE